MAALASKEKDINEELEEVRSRLETILRLEAAATCGICLQEGGLLFTAPCDGKHKFHFNCISRWAKVRDGKLNCPTCRVHLVEYSSAPNSQVPGEVVDSPDPVLECTTCLSECFGTFYCDSCSGLLCEGCVVKSRVSGGQLHFCATCVDVFHQLAEARSDEIATVMSHKSHKFPSCKLCGTVTCYYCDINNGDDDYCVSCVTSINDIYKREEELVKELVSTRKAARKARKAARLSGGGN